MSVQKRKRTANWMASEKSLLVEIVARHFNIVENKKTDGTTMRQKLEHWKLIEVEYNSQTMFTPRLAENLKSQWDSMKKAAKKEAANTRMEILKTGGGPTIPKKEDPCVKQILSLISASAVGLFNPNDSDAILPVSFQDEAAVVTFPQSLDLPQYSQKGIGTNDIPGPQIVSNDDVATSTYEAQTEEFVIKDWGDYSPQLLRTPVSAPLKTLSSNKTGISRRRPSHTPATTSVEMLHKKKIEAINFQKNLATEESDRNKMILEVDLQIKKEILKQEKLKTRLLLLELRKKRKENKENRKNSEE